MLADPDATVRDRVFSEVARRAMVFDGRWKGVHYDSGEGELYDLEGDPNELVNLHGRAEVARVESQLRASLVEHALGNARCHSLARRRPQHPLRVRLEEEYRKQRESAL